MGRYNIEHDEYCTENNIGILFLFLTRYACFICTSSAQIGLTKSSYGKMPTKVIKVRNLDVENCSIAHRA